MNDRFRQERTFLLRRKACAPPSKFISPRDDHITDQLGRIFSLITLTCAGMIAMAGLACLVLGSYGLFRGIHGGPMVAGLLTVFGAGLTFVGYFCGRNSFQSDKDQ